MVVSDWEIYFGNLISRAIIETDAAVVLAVNWLQNTTDGQRLILLCFFVLFVMYVFIGGKRKNAEPVSQKRQAMSAIALIIVVGFGAVGLLNLGGGSLAYLFSR